MEHTADYTQDEIRHLKLGGQKIVGNSPKPFVKRCPECGDLIDLNDAPASLAHIQDKHAKRGAEVMAENTLNDLCNTGILRRV